LNLRVSHMRVSCDARCDQTSFLRTQAHKRGCRPFAHSSFEYALQTNKAQANGHSNKHTCVYTCTLDFTRHASHIPVEQKQIHEIDVKAKSATAPLDSRLFREQSQTDAIKRSSCQRCLCKFLQLLLNPTSVTAQGSGVAQLVCPSAGVSVRQAGKGGNRRNPPHWRNPWCRHKRRAYKCLRGGPWIPQRATPAGLTQGVT